MKRTIRLILLAIMPAVMLVSCDEDDDDTLQKDEARVMVVHASPDAPAVDVLVDDVEVESDLTYPNNSGYLTVEAGTRNIKVNAAGTTTSVIEGSLNFTKDQNYSIFATGSLTANDIEPLVLTDDLTAPTSGNAKVRFVHLSPDAPTVDVAVTGQTTPLFDAQDFRDATGFVSVPTGTYDLEVRLDSDNSVVLLVPDVQLQAGKIYTIFAKGFVTLPIGNTNALGAEIIEHEVE